MNWEGLDIVILGPALITGLLVLSTHIPLGIEVLRRGIIFLDLAVAQIAGLGVIILYSTGWDVDNWLIQLIAIAAALIGAGILYWCEKCWPEVLEAIIGSIFILAASTSVLVLSTNPHGGEKLKELLTGQILWVSYEQLLPLALASILVLALWFGLHHKRSSFLFFGLFAISVTHSVQLVGIYLVFASLILPALTVRHIPSNKLLFGLVTGVSGYGLGLILSALTDLPSGPMIIWCLAISGLFIANIGKVRSIA